IHGGRLSYQIAADDRGTGVLAVTGVQARELHWLQRVKAGTLPSPLTFDVVPRRGGISAEEAVEIIEESLVAFEAAKQQEFSQKDTDSLFTSWSNVLDAQAAYERERSAAVHFSSAIVEGQFVRLKAASGLDGVEPGQARIVETDGKWIKGEVYEISG